MSPDVYRIGFWVLLVWHVLPPDARRFYPNSNLFKTINLDLQQRYFKAGWRTASVSVSSPDDRTSLGVSSRNIKVVYDFAV